MSNSPHRVTRRRKVAVLGTTGTVGQRFISLLAGHPWFDLAVLTTSDAKTGKRYADAVAWHLPGGIPEAVADLRLEPTRPDVGAEICFSALPNEAAAEHDAALSSRRWGRGCAARRASRRGCSARSARPA